MRKLKDKQRGFTLVEVLASIVIISIILLGVAQLMAFTNKSAVSNNIKLVTTHLAKATIERIKVQPENYYRPNQINGAPITAGNCLPNDCNDLYHLIVNDQPFDLTVHVKQTPEEQELKLINVLVTVEHEKRNIKSQVEGYVIDEP